MRLRFGAGTKFRVARAGRGSFMRSFSRQAPVVVDSESLDREFDLVSLNAHVLSSEVRFSFMTSSLNL